MVLPAEPFDETLAFFTDRLGFRVDTIIPADHPAEATVSGHGLRLCLIRNGAGAPGVLRLARQDGDTAEALTAPNGTRIEFAPATPPLVVPPAVPSFVVTRFDGGSKWGTGRAGMQYRDLVPDRQGGYLIASHIRIPDGGPVPDYVHFHTIRFQMIFCVAGWVRLVYQDQGSPFVLEAGDCVLQPPQIRHRVLEASPGLEVVEVGCPAAHMTSVDHEMQLPTERVSPDRVFGGQRFVRHVAAEASWQPWRLPGYEVRDTGIGVATGGVAGAWVARPDGAEGAHDFRQHDATALFGFVLGGSVTLRTDGHGDHALGKADAFMVPAGEGHALTDASGDFELLEVALPAEFNTG